MTSGLGTDDDAAAWAELTRDYDVIAARLTPLDRPELVAAAAARCGPDAHAEVQAFFAPRAAADPRLALALAPTLERIDRCVAERARIQPAIGALVTR